MLFVQVGNHEFVGTKLTRYLDSTWEGLGGKRGGTPPPEEDSSGPHPQGKPWAPLPMEGSSAVEEEWGGDEGLQTMSSATTALGAFLATGNHHGPALTASVPSRSSLNGISLLCSCWLAAAWVLSDCVVASQDCD